MKFKVLSIDAWNDGDSWTWNNWFNNGEYDSLENGELNEENALGYFFNEYYSLNERNKSIKDFLENYDIDDDQYNLVLVRKSDRMPIYAIEYGSQY